MLGSRKLLLVVPSLGAGGAERICVLLAQGLQRLGHQVSVVTIFGSDSDFFALPEGVLRVALDLGSDTSGIVAKLSHNRRRVAAVRRQICEQRPDAVISFLSTANVLALLASVGLRVPVVVTEHADPRRQPLPRAWRLLRRACYPRAAALVSVSRGVDEGFCWLAPQRRAIIANPICWHDIQSAAGDAPAISGPRTVIGMGRLEGEKGFDLLLAAFARLPEELSDWRLTILGEGSQRSALESLAGNLGLGGRVQLPGALRDPFPALKYAGLFVLPSRYEGFGNALVEAMACGLPVVAADCDSGPREIIRPGIDGLLVPPEDASALAAAMAGVMADAERRAQLGAAARQASRRFDLEPVIKHWQDLLQRLTADCPSGLQPTA